MPGGIFARAMDFFSFFLIYKIRATNICHMFYLSLLSEFLIIYSYGIPYVTKVTLVEKGLSVAHFLENHPDTDRERVMVLWNRLGTLQDNSHTLSLHHQTKWD